MTETVTHAPTEEEQKRIDRSANTSASSRAKKELGIDGSVAKMKREDSVAYAGYEQRRNEIRDQLKAEKLAQWTASQAELVQTVDTADAVAEHNPSWKDRVRGTIAGILEGASQWVAGEKVNLTTDMEDLVADATT